MKIQSANIPSNASANQFFSCSSSSTSDNNCLQSNTFDFPEFHAVTLLITTVGSAYNLQSILILASSGTQYLNNFPSLPYFHSIKTKEASQASNKMWYCKRGQSLLCSSRSNPPSLPKSRYVLRYQRETNITAELLFMLQLRQMRINW